jgi:hypothetical protein
MTTVTFYTFPGNVGAINVAGTVYKSGQTGDYPIGLPINIYAVIPEGYEFSMWKSAYHNYAPFSWIVEIADPNSPNTTMTVLDSGGWVQVYFVAVPPPTPPTPKAGIDSISAPVSASAGDSITVIVSFHNAGSTGLLWSEIIDRDTGEIVGVQEPIQLDAGASGSLSWTLTMPNKNWNLRAEAGH